MLLICTINVVFFSHNIIPTLTNVVKFLRKCLKKLLNIRPAILLETYLIKITHEYSVCTVNKL